MRAAVDAPHARHRRGDRLGEQLMVACHVRLEQLDLTIDREVAGDGQNRYDAADHAERQFSRDSHAAWGGRGKRQARVFIPVTGSGQNSNSNGGGSFATRYSSCSRNLSGVVLATLAYF